jgi:acyl carrier protein
VAKISPLVNPNKEKLMTVEMLSALAEYIATEFLRQPERIISPDEALLSTGLIDSFHLVDLALFVEDNFGVHIDDAELNASTFDNLNQLVAFIKSRK